MKPTAEQTNIAHELERIVIHAIVDMELAMDVLKLPASVRAVMWGAVARRATVKMIECEKAGS